MGKRELMRQTSPASYDTSRSEEVQLRVEQSRVNKALSVVISDVTGDRGLDPQPGTNIYAFKMDQDFKRAIITAEFLNSDPPDAEYNIYVQEALSKPNRQSWLACTIKHSNPSPTWDGNTVRFTVR